MDKQKIKKQLEQDWKQHKEKRKAIDLWREHKWIRVTTYSVGTIGVLWASKYLFKFMADSIKAIKELKNAIKE